MVPASLYQRQTGSRLTYRLRVSRGAPNACRKLRRGTSRSGTALRENGLYSLLLTNWRRQRMTGGDTQRPRRAGADECAAHGVHRRSA